jgi:hypothetical protein
MKTPATYPACFSWFATSPLAVSIVPGGGLEECRAAFIGWCEHNPGSVHTYSDIVTVTRWLSRLTVLDKMNYPELFQIGAYKLATEYGF